LTFSFSLAMAPQTNIIQNFFQHKWSQTTNFLEKNSSFLNGIVSSPTFS
jgi:hypothetical protein